MVALQQESAPPGELPALIKPRIDEQDYRLIELPNGLRCLLVSDCEADKAAAACDVRVGSLSDPADVPGLAHFTEHMLFYSSAKYPEEDEYSQFISEHGGHTNAYTSNESTNYHFDVNWQHLEPALDRFAQFFICPLISADGVEREAKAVDSEHGKNLNSDPWRKQQLWRSTANPAHPFSRFSTGSYDTLITQPKAAGADPHERVEQFYRAHYSAGVMRLVVVSRHTLDELEALVRSKFGGVPGSGPAAPPAFGADAVTAQQGGLLIRMVPERDGHSIELQFPTLSEQQHYRQAPSHYVSHLLGHEGEGSAFALLKARGWATGLVAGEAGTSYSARSFFMVRIDLTDEGHAHAREAVAVVFRYLDLLRRDGGVSRQVWEEMRQLAELRFHYRDKQSGYGYASSLAQAMQARLVGLIYAPADLLLGSYSVPLEFDPALIEQVIADLVPEKARVLWASKTLEPDCGETEPWYSTKYSLGPLPDDWLQEWRGGAAPAELHLPEPNPYIPTDFGLLQAKAPQPALALDGGMVRLWHRADPSFKVPKAALYLHLQLPEGYASPEAAVLGQLYCALLNDYLSEVTYPAELAGLHYGVRPTVAGLLVSAYGYSHTLPTLAQAVLDRALNDFEVRPDRFAVVAERKAKDFANMRYEQPYQVALYEAGLALEQRRWHVRDYAAVLPGLTPQALEAFFPRLFSRCSVEAFACGNLGPEAASDFARRLEAQLRERRGAQPPFASQACEQRVVALPRGRPALLALPGPNPANENSAALVAFQVGPDDLRLNALAELSTHIGKRDAFAQLRTKEQLGYIVFCYSSWTLTVRSINLVVQSSAHSAAYLEGRIEAFLPQLAERLGSMPAEEFKAHVEELAKAKLEKPKRLREVAARDWAEIDHGMLRFDRVEQEVAALRDLAQPDLAAFFREYVLEPSTRRKLSVQVEGARGAAPAAAAEGEGAAPAAEGTGGAAAAAAQVAAAEEGAAAAAGVELITDVWAWKRRQQLWGAFK